MALQFQLQAVSSSQARADVLVLLLPAEEAARGASFQKLDDEFEGALSEHLRRAEFSGERGATLVVPTWGRGPAPLLVFSGLGKCAGPTWEKAVLAEALAIGVRASLSHRPVHVGVLAPEGSDGEAVALGAALGAYKFDKYFHTNRREKLTVQKLTVLMQGTPSAADKAAFQLGVRIAQGVGLARDLVNEPPNELYPQVFAEKAREVAKKQGLTVKILDPQGIKKAGMNLHAAVGQGSAHGPYLIHLTYRPKNPRGKIAFVGKGLTFDSGGLCIKPAAGMPDMKSDMAGGAAVLGLMEVVSALGVSVEVHGIIGTAENMPDGNAYRPADVITSLCGKGVEVINTDAEGRLVLADCLTYAARLAPDFMVDAATLTGATLLSLGASYSAYYTNVEPLAQAMQECAARAGEHFWRMPLIEELASQLKSDVTDLKHTGERYGGAISAALFLREFTENVPWMHWDIPGATYRDRAAGLHPKGGTGHAVLTFIELVRAHNQQKIVSAAEAAPASKKAGGRARVSSAPAAPREKAAAKRAPSAKSTGAARGAKRR